MQISRIQNYNTNRPNFKRFNITPHAEELATRSPEKMKLIEFAKNKFKHSEAVDFAIENFFVPNILIKNTGEKLIGQMKATALDDERGLRISDRWTTLDFVLPSGVRSEDAIKSINGQKDKTSKAMQIASLIESSAKEYNGRHLI